jgi:hypothetical protein
MNKLQKTSYTFILLSFIVFIQCNTDHSKPVEHKIYFPDSEQFPDWARVENLRITRLDGGYIEVQKAQRTKWGQGWEEDEYEVLNNIYLEYSDNIIEKLVQGGINAIWVTWSNGWSLQHEAKQQEDLEIFIEKCHQKGIKVIAYICSATIFWENMFIDYPISFDIARKQPSGLPYTYHGENPHRFLANLDHPEWINLHKKRVELALEARIDGFFFDNPGSAEQPIMNQEFFFNAIQKFIKMEKNRPDIPVFSNFGLRPEFQHMNHQLDMVYNEFGRQPGVYEGAWMMGNIKKIKYISSFLPSWKTSLYQSNYYPGGLRERAYMPPKAQKLVRAEAAAFGSTYIDFVEGRLLTDLVHDKKEALDMWNAAGIYNSFLSEHALYYLNSLQPQRIMVLIPDDSEFTFDELKGSTSQLLDFLSQNNVLYSIRLAANLKTVDLLETDLIILLHFNHSETPATEIIESCKKEKCKVLGIGGDKSIENISDVFYQADFIEKLKNSTDIKSKFLNTLQTISRSNVLEISGAPHVLGNITSIENQNRIIIHIINYDDKIGENVLVRAHLKEREIPINPNRVEIFSPDTEDENISEINIQDNVLTFRITKLDTYSIMVVSK